jgi:hypothetical protein
MNKIGGCFFDVFGGNPSKNGEFGMKWRFLAIKGDV